MEGGFTLALEGDNNETNEDVDHEEGDDDQVYKVEKEDMRPVVLYGAQVRCVGVDGNVEDPGNKKRSKSCS